MHTFNSLNAVVKTVFFVLVLASVPWLTEGLVHTFTTLRPAVAAVLAIIETNRDLTEGKADLPFSNKIGIYAYQPLYL